MLSAKGVALGLLPIGALGHFYESKSSLTFSQCSLFTFPNVAVFVIT